MTKYFTNNLPIINLFKKPSINSEIVTQMIYGDSFLVSKKTKNSPLEFFIKEFLAAPIPLFVLCLIIL